MYENSIELTHEKMFEKITAPKGDFNFSFEMKIGPEKFITSSLRKTQSVGDLLADAQARSGKIWISPFGAVSLTRPLDQEKLDAVCGVQAAISGLTSPLTAPTEGCSTVLKLDLESKQASIRRINSRNSLISVPSDGSGLEEAMQDVQHQRVKDNLSHISSRVEPKMHWVWLGGAMKREDVEKILADAAVMKKNGISATLVVDSIRNCLQSVPEGEKKSASKILDEKSNYHTAMLTLPAKPEQEGWNESSVKEKFAYFGIKLETVDEVLCKPKKKIADLEKKVAGALGTSHEEVSREENPELQMWKELDEISTKVEKIYTSERYGALKNYAAASDIIRQMVLATDGGGWYFDMDIKIHEDKINFLKPIHARQGLLFFREDKSVDNGPGAPPPLLVPAKGKASASNMPWMNNNVIGCSVVMDTAHPIFEQLKRFVKAYDANCYYRNEKDLRKESRKFFYWREKRLPLMGYHHKFEAQNKGVTEFGDRYDLTVSLGPRAGRDHLRDKKDNSKAVIETAKALKNDYAQESGASKKGDPNVASLFNYFRGESSLTLSRSNKRPDLGILLSNIPQEKRVIDISQNTKPAEAMKQYLKGKQVFYVKPLSLDEEPEAENIQVRVYKSEGAQEAKALFAHFPDAALLTIQHDPQKPMEYSVTPEGREIDLSRETEEAKAFKQYFKDNPLEGIFAAAPREGSWACMLDPKKASYTRELHDAPGGRSHAALAQRIEESSLPKGGKAIPSFQR